MRQPGNALSISKDSSVLLHLAIKAFYPSRLPFPVLYIDSTWKFSEMIAFRDRMAQELGLDLLIHVNEEGRAADVGPFTHGSGVHTDIMKNPQALDLYGFAAARGAARRDEEKARAKERVFFSEQRAQHRWDPKTQRPELWKLYNTRKNRGESIRVFALSNWRELDIWHYIWLENIPIVPLYYSAPRPVVERDGMLIMVDDPARMPLRPGEETQMRRVRFRTLGCWPLTGAVESPASTLPEIIQEMLLATTSERQGHAIDRDASASESGGLFLMPRQPDPTDADIIACLEAQESKSLLRFITCGSVDDGKSTLIGRLLYESKMIFEDHLCRITRVADTSGQHFRQIKAPACLTQQQRPAIRGHHAAVELYMDVEAANR